MEVHGRLTIESSPGEMKKFLDMMDAKFILVIYYLGL